MAFSDPDVEQLYRQFLAQGLSEVVAGTDQFRQRLEGAALAAGRLSAALQTGAYQKYAKGLAEVSARLGQLQRQAHAEDLVARYGQLGGRLALAGEQAQRLAQRLQGVGRVGAVAFGLLSGTAGGLARQGFGGTVEGAQLAFQWQLLSREIAALFLPLMDRVTAALRRVNDWFRALSGTQQDQVRKWGLLAAGAAGFLAVLPKLVGMGGALAGTLGRLGPLLGQFGGVLGAGALGGPWGLIASGALAAAVAGFAAAFVIAYERSAEFRAEVAKAADQLGRLYDAAKPFIDLALDQMALQMTTAFKVLNFQLELATANVRYLVAQFNRMPAWAQRAAFPLLNAPRADQGPEDRRRDVTLNQTGVETGEATFQRFQQAILTLEANTADPQQQTADNTAETNRWLEQVVAALKARLPDLPELPDARDVIGGARRAIADAFGG